MSRTIRLAIALSLVAASFGALLASAEPPATPEFERTWARTDKPVADGDVVRTWMWGPQPFSGPLTEEYAEAPDGQRVVQYNDKSRFEDNTWRTDPPVEPPWDVTNGLLVNELMSGMMQVGDDQFVEREAARVHIAGDPGYPDAPTYATFALLVGHEPYAEGTVLADAVDGDGNVAHNHDLIGYGVTAAYHVEATNHTVASVFWDFMNSSGLVYIDGMLVTEDLFVNPFYATGYPTTEAYWAHVYVGGELQWVLVQAFERRVLTYTPGNDEGWQVEAGNVGQHYFEWRYAPYWLVPLSGGEEVPAVDTTASGSALFHYSDDGQALHYTLSVTGLVDLTMAHIHIAPAGENGPVAVWLFPDGPPPTLLEGTTTGIVAEGTITANDLVGPLEGQTLEELLGLMRSGDTYVNVHTQQNPPGEIRGQITFQNQRGC
jgi:hypothetical protein